MLYQQNKSPKKKKMKIKKAVQIASQQMSPSNSQIKSQDFSDQFYSIVVDSYDMHQQDRLNSIQMPNYHSMKHRGVYENL